MPAWLDPVFLACDHRTSENRIKNLLGNLKTTRSPWHEGSSAITTGTIQLDRPGKVKTDLANDISHNEIMDLSGGGKHPFNPFYVNQTTKLGFDMIICVMLCM
jgi:hypothetical protein